MDLNLTVFERTTQHPMSIYPKWFARLFSFVLPMAFVSFYPVSGLLHIPTGVNFPIPIDLAIWPPVVGIIWFYFAMKFFNLGLKSKYESAGS